MAMSKENSAALHEIMDSLRTNHYYGRDYNTGHQNEYFGAVLYVTTQNHIGFCHYGSSAVGFNLRDLNWTIRRMFRTTPVQFLNEYIRDDESKVSYMRR